MCACRDGWIACAACNGKGKVEEWLEIVEEPFDRVTWAGSHEMARELPGCSDPQKFDTDFQGRPVPLLFSWRGRRVEDVPTEWRHAIQRSNLAGAHPTEDRIQDIAVQVFRGEITTVEYQLASVSGSVQVQGWDGRTVENPSSREPFRLRRRRVLQGMSGAAMAGAALAMGYGARHSFFRSTPNYGLLWMLALVLGLCLIPLMLWWVLPAQRRSRRGALVAGVPALLVALAQIGFAATGGPSLDHARAAAEKGQLEKALRESVACYDLGIEKDSAAWFHDRLQLGKVWQAHRPSQAWEAAALPFLTEAGREQARAHAVEVTFRVTSALQERGNFAESAMVLDSAPVELRQSGPLVGLRRRVLLASAEPLWKIIESPRKSLEDRVAACTSIAPYLPELSSLPATSDAPSFSTDGVEEECDDLRQQRLREVKRQREAEAREDERAQRRAEAARRAAQMRWAHAPLLCNDGTRSPSCLCGASSHRGCCSWHGGVAGCSVDYPY
jgi:hypothetical protein